LCDRKKNPIAKEQTLVFNRLAASTIESEKSVTVQVRFQKSRHQERSE
jgi:uncharacterized protein YcfL